jgi:hypothetical protein
MEIRAITWLHFGKQFSSFNERLRFEVALIVTRRVSE